MANRFKLVYRNRYGRIQQVVLDTVTGYVAPFVDDRTARSAFLTLNGGLLSAGSYNWSPDRDDPQPI